MKMDSVVPNNKMFFAALFLGLVGAWPPAFGQALHRDQVAEVDVLETLILFHPYREAMRWDLSVSGPGGFFKSTEFFGESPFFLLEDEEGVSLSDGRYTFELRAWSPAEHFDPHRDTQSGSFSVVDGQAEFLGAKRKDIGEVFPAATNPAGNHFVGPLTTDSDFCAGCADGELADVGASAGRARLKGFSDYLIFDEDSPDALWRIGSANEVFFFDDLTYGTLDVVAFDPGAPTNSLRISSVGFVGLGTATPSAPLDVRTMIQSGTQFAVVDEATGGYFSVIDGKDAPYFPLFWFRGVGVNGNGGGFVSELPAANDVYAGNEKAAVVLEGRRSDGTNLVNTNILSVRNKWTPALWLTASGNLYTTGSITPGSSRDLKEEIENLSLSDAMEVLAGLEAVTFRYKGDQEKDLKVGFIAEDVPELVATPDRKGVSSMDIVGVLTRVVQEQQEEISRLKMKLAEVLALVQER